MVSGFFTSPWDHSRIFSGLASEIRIALNESGSLGFSKKLKMSRMERTSDQIVDRNRTKLAGAHPPFDQRHYSSSSAATSRPVGVSTSSTFRQRDWSSLMSTLKLSGRPASSVYS